MRRSELQLEENYNEYLRLLQDDDYLEVTRDEESGGVSAVHKLHKFAKKKGPSGMRQGDYERTVLDVLRKRGHRVILGAETNHPGVKSFDGFLDDDPMEIKAIEGLGIWAISTKLRYANKQRARRVVLYFPCRELFTEERILDGIGKYLADPSVGNKQNIKQLLAISGNEFLGAWDKKATPIEGWSI